MSYTVVIADDEPLVLIGLRDMIDWASEGFEITGQARNGGQLAQEIMEKRPDLVITDIKMPVKSGIEVLEEIRSSSDNRLPLFIFLTSFEEFDLIKKAMSLEAVDYIVKLELDKSQLSDALKRTREKIEEIKGHESDVSGLAGQMRALQERFLVRKLYSIGKDDPDPSLFGLDLDREASFAVVLVTLPDISNRPPALFYSALRLLDETVNRYTKCFTIQLDTGHIAAILPFSEKQKAGYRSYITSAFRATLESLKDFFSLDATVVAGPLVDSLDRISVSFMKARSLASSTPGTIVFYDHMTEGKPEPVQTEFDSELFTRAFTELNAELLAQGIEECIDQIRQPAVTTVHAVDLASSILYLASSIVPDADKALEEIFPSEENIFSYRQIYQAMDCNDVISWLRRFSDGFTKLFTERKQDYRMQTIQKVQAYIRENVDRKLSLGSVASIFGYSQNYLSSLFSKYAGMSFVDYVNTAKVEKAKTMLADPNTMVYEVATSLGFESPFYFSKVFKKVTGLSPTQYQNSTSHKGEK